MSESDRPGGPVVLVRNLGPIREATVPSSHQVFMIGPNGSGKSTLAKVYAGITSACATYSDWPVFRQGDKGMNGILSNAKRRLEVILLREIEDMLGSRLPELRLHRGQRPRYPEINVSVPGLWDARITSKGGKAHCQVTWEPGAEEILIDSTDAEPRVRPRRSSLAKLFPWSTWDSSTAYLPAGRSGLVAARDTLATSFVLLASEIGRRDVNVPAFPRPLAVFLNSLVADGGRFETAQDSPAASELRSMLGGEMKLLDDSSSSRLIFVHEDREVGPIETIRWSSMQSELAPLGHVLRRISRDSVLILEEPESHVHPALMSQLATVLLSYAPPGILFCTTHSDLLLRWYGLKFASSGVGTPVLLTGSPDRAGVGGYVWSQHFGHESFIKEDSLIEPTATLFDAVVNAEVGTTSHRQMEAHE